MSIELGDKVRDTVSGLKGIAVARCSYLNGCDHIGTQILAKDGKIPPMQWVDLPQVETVGLPEKKKLKYESPGRVVGGPAQHPTGSRHPSSGFEDEED